MLRSSRWFRQKINVSRVHPGDIIGRTRNSRCRNIMPQSRVKRLAAFASVGMLLIAMALGYLYFWMSRPIGSGSAGPAVPATIYSGVWSDKPVLLVGLGDS